MRDVIMTTREVAEMAKVDDSTVLKAVADQKLKGIEAFRCGRFWLSDVLVWLGRDDLAAQLRSGGAQPPGRLCGTSVEPTPGTGRKSKMTPIEAAR